MDDKDPTLLLCDNMSSIQLVRNPVMHQRTKHIELDHHLYLEKTTEWHYQCNLHIHLQSTSRHVHKAIGACQFYLVHSLDRLYQKGRVYGWRAFRAFRIDENNGTAMEGVTADRRKLSQYRRWKSINHHVVHESPLPMRRSVVQAQVCKCWGVTWWSLSNVQGWMLHLSSSRSNSFQ